MQGSIGSDVKVVPLSRADKPPLLKFMTMARSDRYAFAIDVLLIACVSCLVFFWFGGPCLINPADTNFCFNPINDLYRSLFGWDYQQGLGVADVMATAKIFPYHALMALLALLGISLYSSQQILFYLLFFGSGFSSYLFFRYLLGTASSRRIARMVGVSFYMMNAHLIHMRWGGGYIMPLFFYAVFPALLLMWWKGRATLEYRYSIYFALISLLALPTLNNPAYLAPLLVITGVDMFLQLLSPRVRVHRPAALLKHFVRTWLTFAFVAAIWLAAISITFMVSVQNIAASTKDFNQAEVTASAASVINLFRFLANLGFFGDYAGEPYFPYSGIYKSAAFVFLGLMIFALGIFGSMGAWKTRDKTVRYNLVFFGAILIVGLWLTKGVHPPFGGIFRWALQHLPVFTVFRVAIDKFADIVIVSLAFLLAIGVASLQERFRRPVAKTLVGWIVLISINVYVWPFWTATIWKSKPKIMGEWRIRIPPEYGEFAAHYRKVEDARHRILQLPDNAALVPGIISLRFNGVLYTGSDPLGRILTEPILYLNPFDYGVSDNFMSGLYKAYSSNINEFARHVAKVGKVVDVRHVMWRGDSDSMTYPQIGSAEALKPGINALPLDRKFGAIELYKIPDDQHVSAAYIAKSIRPAVIESSSTIPADFFWDIVRKQTFGVGDVFLFGEQNTEKRAVIRALLERHSTKWEKSDVVNPRTGDVANIYTTDDQLGRGNLEFTRINPTRFHARLTNAKGAFPVVLSESFHPGWKVYILPNSGARGREGSNVDAPSKRDLSFLPTWWARGLIAKCGNNLFDLGDAREIGNSLGCDDFKLEGAERFWLLPGRAIEWPEVLHWRVNGYANAWWFDEAVLQNLRAGKKGSAQDRYVRVNDDGTIEMEFIIEFSHQKRLIIGYFITFAGLAWCAFYLVKKRSVTKAVPDASMN